MNSTSWQAKSATAMRAAFMLSALAWLFSTTVSAQDEVDPSSRVARISYLQSGVSVQLAQSGEWIQARLNRPLTNHDQVMTDAGSRAELQVGMATIHLDENTQLGFMELSDNVLQVRLNQGVMNITVRGMDNDDVIEVDTPNASVTIPEPGSYRIEVRDGDDATVVQVRDGSADVAGERQRYTVKENEQVTLRGSRRLNAQFDDLDRPDDFDRWVASRNSRARNATAARYVDSNVIGYEDLDDYGYWRWEAGYGDVWYPNRIARGWAPYRYGHWDWIAPWGWTWMDDQPWGFAPFHYGRWVEVHHRWCWTPGRREVRAVYAPALVAWVGAPGVSVSVNINTRPVGWIPLGPREMFRPHYVASAVYLSRVNVSNSLLNHDDVVREVRDHNRGDVFVNRHAASMVAASTFTAGGRVDRNLMPVEPRMLNPLESIRELRPDHAAIVGGARVISPPVRVIDREVVVQRRPSPFINPRDVDAPRSDSPVGGSVRVIDPINPRRGFGDRSNDDRHSTGSPDASSVHRDQRDETHRTDRWGRDNQIDNRQIDSRFENGRTSPDNGENQRRDWHVTPSPGHRGQRDVNSPEGENRLNRTEPASPETERRRIGPWVREEQQLRPEPQQREVQPPPQRTPQPAPRMEPPRSNNPPPAPPPQSSSPPSNSQSNPPNNQGGDRHPRERREIR